MMLAHAADVRCTRTAHSRADEESSALPTLVLPRRGLFRFHAGRRTELADANTALLFHPDEPYRITHPTDDGDDCFALRYARDALADALGAAGESSRAWTLRAPAHRALHRRARAAVAAHDALAREEHALHALAIVADASPVANGAPDAARIDAVRERIAAAPAERATLAELARGAGVSPFHLARRFRARTGTSLHQYRLALRLNVALARLREGADDLTALALDLGFSSHAHFTTAFGAAFGCAPSAVATGTSAAATDRAW
jgi:AraC-like DNA-binding protein